MHRTKSILAALAAVALSATAVFAAASAPPKAAEDGLATARTASGQTVPVRAEGPDATRAARSPEASESPDARKSPKAAESPDVDATTGTTKPHPDNHGKAVSEAAQASTPPGFVNHGAYVSSIAKQNHGHVTPPVRTPISVHVPSPSPSPTPTAH